MRIRILILAICVIPTSGFATDNYFPEGSLAERKDLGNFTQEWYGKNLKALEEPALSLQDQEDTYRFLWLRTFHEPMAFRLLKSGKESFKLVIKKTGGAGGYEPGEIIVNKTIDLSNKQIHDLLDKINECDFWNMPSQEKDIGADGSQWILEGKKGGEYHFVDRWSPESGCIYEIGRMFMKYSNLKIENIY